jgi:hypothetical protein
VLAAVAVVRRSGPSCGGATLTGAARAAVAVAAVTVTAVGVGGGCDWRTTLAQSEWFAGERPGLIAACCACLAARGTADPDASCTLAVLVDGEIVVPDGALYGSGNQGRELNDAVDDGEIPCLCAGDEGVCVDELSRSGGRLVVPGACIDQVDREAPCEAACGGVLSFVPVGATD